MKNQIICGDCKEVLRRFPPNTFDTIITDPPYGLGFMGKEWDNLIEPTRDSAGGFLRNGKSGSNPYAAVRCRLGNDTNQMQQWHYNWAKICLRVAKPGAMMLVFGGTRTFHRLACAIEDAGWEIRDCMMWLYGQGFPKSHNLKGEWNGWGTSLKPAWEPIIVAMKPLDGTFAHNAETWGVAGLNIDGGRIKHNEPCKMMKAQTNSEVMTGGGKYQQAGRRQDTLELKPEGRWPANLLLDEESAEILGEPARFFYCAKASRKEREAGLDDLPDKLYACSGGAQGQVERGEDEYLQDSIGLNRISKVKNNHPTVKPLALMEYLCKLTKTPTDGFVLDPFGGSGTTALACIKTGRDYILIEKEPEYCKIANKRIGGLTGELDAANLNKTR